MRDLWQGVGLGITFPEKTFDTTPSTLTVKYLPSGSATGDGTFYSLVDAETEDIIVPFGSGSK